MAAAVRSRPLLTYVWFFLNLVNVILASPIGLSSNFANSHYILRPRDRSGVIINDADGSVAVFNSQTQQLIPQGSASDGGGSGFGAPAVLWVVVLFILGVPLAVAGIRGWRLTIGAAIGLSTAVCCEYIQFIICSTGLTNPTLFIQISVGGLYQYCLQSRISGHSLRWHSVWLFCARLYTRTL